jgi:hypothetical protein
MNTAQTIVNALLDSSAEAFMKSFKQKQPVRWEFLPSIGAGMYTVQRWNWDGTSPTIGEIQRIHKYPEKWTIRAVEELCNQDGDVIRDTYVPSVKHYSTAEKAAEKLWELYNEE